MALLLWNDGLPTGAEESKRQPRRDASGPSIIRMVFVGTNRAPTMSGVGQVVSRSSYFTAKNPEEWITGVPSFAKVRYRDLYPGIDLEVYGNQKNVEYDFIVRPGSDPDSILLKFSGFTNLDIGQDGELVLKTASGTIMKAAPFIYQQDAGLSRTPVKGEFVKRGNNRIAFKVGSYDRTRPLVIDPVLVYSTTVGGRLQEEGTDIAVDSNGDVYITGSTDSLDFPTVNPIQATCTACVGTGFRRRGNVFVFKMSADGSRLIYSTYLNAQSLSTRQRVNNRIDIRSNIVVDEVGNAYISGAAGLGFPTTPGAFQSLGDAFVVKLNPTGSGLVYSTLIGGSSGRDQINGLAIDSEGNAYITGSTSSPDFPLVNPIQDSCVKCGDGFGAPMAFVAKLNAAGSDLIYSTFLGGSDTHGVATQSLDGGDAIAVDENGVAYVTGRTTSIDFPLVNPLQNACGDCTDASAFSTDAFVAALVPDGSSLMFSTYLGGSGSDAGADITVDATGVYVVGRTASLDFPIVNAFQTVCSDCDDPHFELADAFVTKLTTDGTSFVFSSYLGGLGADQGTSIAADSQGAVYVTGQTSSRDFPVIDAFKAVCSGCTNRGRSPGRPDAFVSKIAPSGSSLLYSSYLGDVGHDNSFGIAVDKDGNVYVTGSTSLDSLTLGGRTNGFFVNDVLLARISERPPPGGPVDPPVDGCTNIAGTWEADEDGTLTCTVSTGGEAITDTQSLNGSGIVDIEQASGSCTFGYDPVLPSSQAFFQGLRRTGEIAGDRLEMSGPMAIPVSGASGVSVSTNSVQATGQVRENNTIISASGSGRFVGTIRVDTGELVNVDCTGSSTAVLSRVGDPPVVLGPPILPPNSAVNGASFTAGALAPASWADLFGQDLATQFLLDGELPVTLDGTTLVVIDSRGTSHQARLHFVTRERIQFLVPDGVVVGPAKPDGDQFDGCECYR